MLLPGNVIQVGWKGLVLCGSGSIKQPLAERKKRRQQKMNEFKKKFAAFVRESRQVATEAIGKSWIEMKTGGLEGVDFMLLRQYLNCLGTLNKV
jgi:hypothetical protein